MITVRLGQKVFPVSRHNRRDEQDAEVIQHLLSLTQKIQRNLHISTPCTHQDTLCPLPSSPIFKTGSWKLQAELRRPADTSHWFPHQSSHVPTGCLAFALCQAGSRPACCVSPALIKHVLKMTVTRNDRVWSRTGVPPHAQHPSVSC